jgi:hypothetical protein
LASFLSVTGALIALKDYLELHMAGDLAAVVANPRAEVLGSQALHGDPGVTNALGIYLHRVSVDPYGRNRYLAPTRPDRPAQPELPVNLHILLVGWSPSATAETHLVAWAMQQIGSSLTLDIANLGQIDEAWRGQDSLQVIPEEMSTEDLMRLWDSLPGDYRLSSPYIIKTLRLEPARPVTQGPPVKTLVLPVEGSRTSDRLRLDVL